MKMKMMTTIHTVFAVIATVTPYIVQAGTDCFTGAVFHGGGFVMNNSIANLDEFTLESWVTIEHPEVSGVIMWLDIGNLRYQTSGNSFLFQLSSWDSRAGGTGTMRTISCALPSVVDYSIPFHVAGTISGPRTSPNMKMYFNGIEATTCRPNTWNPQGTYFTDSVGAHAESQNDGSVSDHHQFQGWMNEVRVWDTARTIEDIQSTMQTRIEENMTNLVAVWNFVNARFEDGGRVPDVTGRHDGVFQWVDGAVRCNGLDQRVSYHVAILEANVSTVSETLQNETADIRSQLSSAVSQIDSQSSQIDTQASVIASLQSQLNTVLSRMNNIGNNLDVVSAEASRPVNYPVPSCPRRGCSAPQIQATAADLLFTARSAEFQLGQCDVNICDLQSDMSAMRSAVVQLSGN